MNVSVRLFRFHRHYSLVGKIVKPCPFIWRMRRFNYTRPLRHFSRNAIRRKRQVCNKFTRCDWPLGRTRWPRNDWRPSPGLGTATVCKRRSEPCRKPTCEWPTRGRPRISCWRNANSKWWRTVRWSRGRWPVVRTVSIRSTCVCSSRWTRSRWEYPSSSGPRADR